MGLSIAIGKRSHKFFVGIARGVATEAEAHIFQGVEDGAVVENKGRLEVMVALLVARCKNDIE